MADINLNNLDGIPFGNNAGRPSNPGTGQPYFNGEASRLELYTSNGWQNITQETPSVVNVTGAARESGSSTVTINGTNFAVGCSAYAVGSNGVEYQATSTSLISVVQLTAVFPALSLAYEPYDIKVINPSNLYGVLYDSLNVDASPVWTTGSGSLGTYIEESSMSVQVTATDAADPSSSQLIYSISSGSLPNGLSINSATGVISGTPTSISSSTTYSFTANAYDGVSNTTRNFSITITDRGPTWVTSATLPTFAANSSYSTTLSATNDDATSITYSLFSGSLPTGLSLNSSTGVISGTPTSSSNATFTIRATEFGGAYSDRQFTMPNASPIWSTASGTLVLGVAGSAYSYQLSATDDGSITYSIISGSLPSGLSLSSSGLISGTPTTGGSSTFTVRASDANTSVDRSFTISVTVYGATRYQTPGTYTFTVPAGVTSVSVVAVGGGQGGGGAGNTSSSVTGGGGAGGGLSYGNVSVTPGQAITVTVGAGGAGGSGYSQSGQAGGTSSFGSFIVAGGGSGSTSIGANGTFGGSGTGGTSGGTSRLGGGIGGQGGKYASGDAGGGGGGAGGYSGNGGAGGDGGPDGGSTGPAQAGSGGAGGGGAGGPGGNDQAGSAGGGVGLFGLGSNGSAGGGGATFVNSSTTNGGGGGGSGGSAGGSNNLNTAGAGGLFGGGGGGGNGNVDTDSGGAGGGGAVRIIWGQGREFPSTNTSQNYFGIAETVI